MGWKLTPRNLISVALAPVTGGASLALAKDDKGNYAYEHLTGAASAREANEQNIAYQNATNEKMIGLSNTAHQREVADLEAAHLNPILSAQGSGATTPALGTPQIQNENPGGILANANQAATLLTGLAQAQNFNANTGLQKAQTLNTMTDTQYMPAMKKAEIAANYANAGNARAQADYTKVMTDVDKEIKQAETEQSRANKDLIEANTYRTKNVSKGEQSRLWTQAITGGLLNVAGGMSGGMSVINSARMTPAYSGTHMGFGY